MQSNYNMHILLVKLKMVLFGKHVGSCLKGLMILTNDPVIPLLSIYSREMETYNDTKTYT